MKTTEELAREAGFEMIELADISGSVVYGYPPELDRFRRLVRNEALEEAAALCDLDPFRAEAGHAIRALKT